MKTTSFLVILALALTITGCAFFNTYFNARKSYNNGVASLKKSRETSQSAASQSITLDRFSLEGVTPTEEAKKFFGLAIEKGNKVVVLHPMSSWVADAILLMGKAHYLRGTGNDYYDAKNRFEVFMTRYPSSPMLPEAKLWYGKTLLRLRLESEASEALRQIPFLTKHPDLIAESLIYLGDLSSANPDVALDYYQRAAEQECLATLRRVALFKSAFLLYTFGRFEESIGYFQKLNKQDLEISERFDVILLSARCFKALGQHGKAISMLDKTVGDLRYKNHFAQAEFEIAEALYRQGKLREAEKQFNHVIDSYKNPLYSGDAFYMLGLMHDTSSASDADGWRPQRDMAVKYYSIVRNKYAASTYASSAGRRLDLLQKLEKIQCAIRADEFYLSHIRHFLDGPVDRPEMPPGDSVQKDSGVLFSAAVLIREDQILRRYLDDTIQTRQPVELPKESSDEIHDDLGGDERGRRSATKTAPKETAPSIAELENVRLDNSELKNIVAALKSALQSLYTTTPADSLTTLDTLVHSRIASHYMTLADYFDQTLANYDSAAHYYAKVATEFPGSSSEEQAYYSVARIHMKQKSSFYRHAFETAMEKFPNGQLVSVARHVLGLLEAPDTMASKMEEAEKLIFEEKDFRTARQRLEDIAHSDSGMWRRRALYVKGWLQESKLLEPDSAFITYNTLAFLEPTSELAKRVTTKVADYARRRGISQDSLRYWTDTRYYRPPAVVKVEPVFEPASTRSDTASASDTTQFPLLDSLQVRSMLDSLEMPVDSLFLKKLESDSTRFDDRAINEEEDDGPPP